MITMDCSIPIVYTYSVFFFLHNKNDEVHPTNMVDVRRWMPNTIQRGEDVKRDSLPHR